MSKAKGIMLQGTASSVGKSLLTTALCRIFHQDGLRTAPFKSQNMALNSFVTADGLEMGRAQVVQAEAAGCEPHVDMNPILLKPTSDRKSQVILRGRVYQNMPAMEYFRYKPQLRPMIEQTYAALAARFDMIVLEGAGSPAEINLKANDIVNMGMAEMADVPVILIGDIDRGGVFASLLGTMMLLEEHEKARVCGVIINKFRGDVEILRPGLSMLEDLIHVPVLGVVPYLDVQIDDEDSLAERFTQTGRRDAQIRIEVLCPKRMSNFTDFSVFDTQEDVYLRYVTHGQSLGEPDLLILPGSKNTLEDLVVLRNSGLEEQILRLHRKGTRIVGICGGYQMLGNTLRDPHGSESTIGQINGLGLLDVETTLEQEKTTRQVSGHVLGDLPGVWGQAALAPLAGYEIHVGTTTLGSQAKPFARIEDAGQPRLDGAVNSTGRVMGTYVHGVFDNMAFTDALLNAIRLEKGMGAKESSFETLAQFKQREYDRLADHVRKSLDMPAIYAAIEKHASKV